VVSGRKVTAVVDELGRDLLISGARLVPARGGAGPRVALNGPDGLPLDAITWTPAKPGLTILARAAPLLLLIGAVLAAVCVSAIGVSSA
jgi:hypothetical protein